MQHNYTEIVERMSKGYAFDGNTMHSTVSDIGECGSAYTVYSYGTPIFYIVRVGDDVVAFRNEAKYSTTTSKHQHYAARAWGRRASTLESMGFTIRNVFLYGADAIRATMRNTEAELKEFLNA